MELASAARRKAPSDRSLEHRLKALTSSIAQAGRVQQWKKAVALLDEACCRRLRLNIIVTNAAMAACEKAKQWQAVLALLSSRESDMVGWNSALSACEKGGAWPVALSLYDEIVQRHLQPDAVTFGLLVRLEQVAGGWLAALGALSNMRAAGFCPNVMNYAVVLRACKDAGSWQVALALVSTMLQEGVRPDVLAVNAAIGACTETGSWEVAVGLFELMHKEALAPSTASANVVMKICGQGGAWHVVFLVMDALSAGLGEGRDAVSYGTALTAYGRARRSDQISRLLSEVVQEDILLTEVSFTAALTVASWTQVVQLLACMGRQGLRPGLSHLTSAMFSCTADGAWHRALQLHEKADLPSVNDNAIALIALLQASRYGRPWAATLSLLQDAGLRPSALIITEAGRAFDSHSWPLSIALISAARARGVEANEVGRTIAARAFTCAGLWQQSLGFAAAAGSWYQCVALLAAAALRRVSPQGCARPWEKPSPWRQTLQYLARLVENPSEALDTGQRCVAAFARSGDYDALQKVFGQLRALRLEPDVIPAFTALSTLAQTGAWRDAAALLRALRDVQVEVQLVAHHRLLGAMHSAGRWQEVVTCLDGIRQSGYRPDIFSFGLALAARDPVSSWRGAVAFLAMLQDETLEASRVALGAASQRAERAHHWTLALHFCASMQVQSLTSTRGFSSAISACENLSQWRQVSMLLRHMSGTQLRRDAVLCNAAAAASSGAGRWAEALGLLSSGVLRDKTACGTGLFACGRTRAWQASLRLITLATQHQVQVDMPSRNVVVSCCEHALHTIGVVGL
ncbi:PPR10, partial [Symbiodinium sp. CCMP2456]